MGRRVGWEWWEHWASDNDELSNSRVLKFAPVSLAKARDPRNSREVRFGHCHVIEACEDSLPVGSICSPLQLLHVDLVSQTWNKTIAKRIFAFLSPV